MSQREKLPVDASNQLLVALAVKEKIANRKNWCVNSFAQDANGEPLSWTEIKSKGAVSFCLRGARFAVLDKFDSSQDHGSRDEGEFAKFLGFDGCSDIAAFNNSSTHADVIARLDHAIQNAKIGIQE